MKIHLHKHTLREVKTLNRMRPTLVTVLIVDLVVVVTEAFMASAPWLDGPSDQPPGPLALSLSPSPQGANLCCYK